MSAITQNLYIEQGTDYSVVVNVSNTSGGVFDLTGATAASVIKSPTGTLIESFTTSINASAGVITLSLTGATTAAASITGAAKWDLIVKLSTGKFYRLIQGDVFISPAQSTLS